MSQPGTEAEWRAVAERVMKREFTGCDDSTKQSLLAGLRHFDEIRFKQAIIKLEEDGSPTSNSPPKQTAPRKAPKTNIKARPQPKDLFG